MSESNSASVNLPIRGPNEYPESIEGDVPPLSNRIRELVQLYSHRIQVKVIDALSPLGPYKTVRHRIREFPTFIIENRDTYSG
ncbi:MAG: hypothetical protein ACETWT_00445 [Thermodesulfobacteriota bacterium]